MRLFPDSGPWEPFLKTKESGVLSSYVKEDEELHLDTEVFDEVCLTNVFPFWFVWPMIFPFWPWVKVEKHLKMLRVASGSFSLPRVWRHWSYIGMMTRVKKLTNGPQKHMLEQSHVSKEPKSQMWVLHLATLCAWYPTPNLPSYLRQFASFLHLQFKSLIASSTLQVQGSSQRFHHVNNYKDSNFFKAIMVLEDQM